MNTLSRLSNTAKKSATHRELPTTGLIVQKDLNPRHAVLEWILNTANP